jgi:hypothetical protein
MPRLLSRRDYPYAVLVRLPLALGDLLAEATVAFGDAHPDDTARRLLSEALARWHATRATPERETAAGSEPTAAETSLSPRRKRVRRGTG